MITTFEKRHRQLGLELLLHGIDFELSNDLAYGLTIYVTKNKEGTYSIDDLSTYIIYYNNKQLIEKIMKKYNGIRHQLIWRDQ